MPAWRWSFATTPTLYCPDFNSDIMSGSGSALDTMDVDVEGYKVSSALVDHVHVQIQEEDSTGRWVNVPLGAEYLYYP